MDIHDTKSMNCKCTNYRVILTILGLSTCLFLAGTTYFLVKTYNQNKIISGQLLEYNNQLNFTKNQPLVFDDNFELRMRKLFDELDLTPKQSLFNSIDQNFFNYRNHMNNLLNNSYSMNRSTIKALDNEYLITLTVPGFTKDQIKIDLNGNILTIWAESSNKTEESDNKKDISSTFKQVISLNNDIERNSIKSSLKDGILTINIPRIQQKIEPKIINIE
jgi:HSP20 family protein